MDDDLIKRRFLMGTLSPGLLKKLHQLVRHSRYPLAVRSSGLLEDSLSHPFAGLYSTFFLPNNHPELEMRESQLVEAIKMVYASVFSKQSRAYFEAIDYKIEEEQMAVLIQEVAGNRFGDHFYPHVSGVAPVLQLLSRGLYPAPGRHREPRGRPRQVRGGGREGLPVLPALSGFGHAGRPGSGSLHAETLLRPGHELHLPGPFQWRGRHPARPWTSGKRRKMGHSSTAPPCGIPTTTASATGSTLRGRAS